MTLFPVEHERRLTSAAEAEALYRALGAARVRASGYRTRDPIRFERLVAAIEPRLDHTISFEAGMLTSATLDALDALALQQRYGYLDVRSDASLRIYLMTPKSLVTAPFSLKDVALP